MTTHAVARRVRARAAVPVACAVGLAGDLALDPVHRHVPLCPFHSVTGWSCPLCGGLRCAQALAHLDVTTALRDNAPLVLALPFLAWAWLLWARGARPGRPVRLPVSSRVAWAVVACVAVVFTVVRNLPGLELLRAA